MRNLRYTYAKCIYNRHNLPFWLITRCWWEAAAAVGCFQDKYESLGSRRGEHFLVSKDFSCYHPPWSPRQPCEAGEPPPSSFCSTARHSSPPPCGHVAPKPEEGVARSRAWLLSLPPPCWSGGPMVPKEAWGSSPGGLRASARYVSTDDTSPRAATLPPTQAVSGPWVSSPWKGFPGTLARVWPYLVGPGGFTCP